jgi:hypothetical protein
MGIGIPQRPPEESGQYNKNGRVADALSWKCRYKLCNARVEKLGLASVGREWQAFEGQTDGVECSDGPSSRGFDNGSNVG